MRKIFTLAVSGMFLFLGCGEDKGSAGQESENKLGCITGKITIFNTGSSTDAHVQLLISKNGEAIHSERIGRNGDYTIDNVEEGVYYFKVYKKNFVDTLFHETIRILPKEQNGGSCRKDRKSVV